MRVIYKFNDGMEYEANLRNPKIAGQGNFLKILADGKARNERITMTTATGTLIARQFRDLVSVEVYL